MGYYRWFWCLWAFNLATVGYDKPLLAPYAPALQLFGEQNVANPIANVNPQSAPDECNITFDELHDICCSTKPLKSHWRTSPQKTSGYTPYCCKQRQHMCPGSPKNVGFTVKDAKQQRNLQKTNPEHRGCKISTSVFPATNPLAGSNEYHGLLQRTTLSCTVNSTENKTTECKKEPNNRRFCVSNVTTLALFVLAYMQCFIVRWSCATLTTCLSHTPGRTNKIQPITYLLGFFVGLLSTSTQYTLCLEKYVLPLLAFYYVEILACTTLCLLCSTPHIFKDIVNWKHSSLLFLCMFVTPVWAMEMMTFTDPITLEVARCSTVLILTGLTQNTMCFITPDTKSLSGKNDRRFPRITSWGFCQICKIVFCDQVRI